VSGLVREVGEWQYSSYPDYSGIRNGTLCDKDLFFSLTGLTANDVLLGVQAEVDENNIEKFY